jgi:hypothetical protein
MKKFEEYLQELTNSKIEWKKCLIIRSFNFYFNMFIMNILTVVYFILSVNLFKK